MTADQGRPDSELLDKSVTRAVRLWSANGCGLSAVLLQCPVQVD